MVLSYEKDQHTIQLIAQRSERNAAVTMAALLSECRKRKYSSIPFIMYSAPLRDLQTILNRELLSAFPRMKLI